jgi:hypothetical protein
MKELSTHFSKEMPVVSRHFKGSQPHQGNANQNHNERMAVIKQSEYNKY